MTCDGDGCSGNAQTLRFGHAGGNVGFRATFVLFVQSGDGTVVMTNDNAGDVLAQELLRAIAAEYSWPDDEFRTHEHPVANLSAVHLKAIAGSYKIEDNGTPIEISSSNNGLRFEMRFKSPIELLPSSELSFFSTSHDREVQFERSTNEGQISGGKVLSNGVTLFQFIRAAK